MFLMQAPPSSGYSIPLALLAGTIAGMIATSLSSRLNRATDRLVMPADVIGQVRQFMANEPLADFWQSYRAVLRELSRLALLKIGVMLLVFVPVLLIHQLSTITAGRTQTGNRNPLWPVIDDTDFAFFAMTASASMGYAIFRRFRS